MKIIFLDIDGVLNYIGCKYKSPTGCLGIDPEKVCLLKQIVDATAAKIVLTSTWKTDWFRTSHIEDLPKDGQYMCKQLLQYGLRILDKTEDTEWSKRGEGILNWLNNYSNTVESFVIIDDESFDFEEQNLINNFVHTDFADGIQISHVQKAIEILLNRKEKSLK